MRSGWTFSSRFFIMLYQALPNKNDYQKAYIK